MLDISHFLEQSMKTTETGESCNSSEAATNNSVNDGDVATKNSANDTNNATNNSVNDVDVATNNSVNDEDVATNNSVNDTTNMSINDADVNKSPAKRSRALAVEDTTGIGVPEGWRRQIVQRQGGVSAGKFDVYYFSPLGKKLRSKKEVESHCQMNNLYVDPSLFMFSHSMSGGPKKRKSLPASLVQKSPKKKKIPATPEAGLSTKKVMTPKSAKLKSPKLKLPAKVKKSETSFKISHDFTLKKKKRSIWVPPKSPFNLFQENLFQNPWKLLIGTIFHTRVPSEDGTGNPLMWNFLKRWPTPELIVEENVKDIETFLKSVPNNDKMTKIIVKFSEDFVKKTWNYPKELQGIGKFGNDSYRVFCINEWRKVKPTDCLLNFYVSWLWDNHEVFGLP